MASVTFKIVSASNFGTDPIKPSLVNGQIIFVKPSNDGECGSIWVDYGKDGEVKRTCYTPSSSGGDTPPVGDHKSFLGISETNPEDTWPRVNDSDVPNPPNDGDWVAYGTKEYFYNANSSDLWKWKPFGDEDAEAGKIAWNDDDVNS